MIVSTTVLLALALADSWTTWRVLSQGGREANPLAARLINRTGIGGWTALKLALVAAGAAAMQATGAPWAPWLLAALCVLYAVVVTNNFAQLRNVKGRD